jgi:hypothetical protein
MLQGQCANGFHLAFYLCGPKAGSIASMRLGKNELSNGGPIPCFWRAPTDNDRGGEGLSYCARWRNSGIDQLSVVSFDKFSVVSLDWFSYRFQLYYSICALYFRSAVRRHCYPMGRVKADHSKYQLRIVWLLGASVGATPLQLKSMLFTMYLLIKLCSLSKPLLLKHFRPFRVLEYACDALEPLKQLSGTLKDPPLPGP